jgi:hypothetical protein
MTRPTRRRVGPRIWGMKAWLQWQRAEGRGQRAEGRGQRAEGRGERKEESHPQIEMIKTDEAAKKNQTGIW